MDILLLIVLGFCLKAGVDQARKASASSKSAKLKDIKAKHPKASKGRRSALLRRHTAGYWASEILHGFPEFRHGAAAGWHAHQSASAEALAARAKAKADHAETRSGVAEQIAIHRKRMQMALEQQRKLEEPAQDPDGGSADVVPPPLPEPAGPALTSVPTGPDAGPPGWNDPLPRPRPAAPRPGPAQPGWSQPPGWNDPLPGPQGSPEAASSSTSPNPPDQPEPAATTGAPVATAETTYTQDIADASAIVAEAEQHLASLRRHKWADRTEALAQAGLDSASLSRAADMNDSIAAQIKAAEQTLDNATAFRDGLISTHQAGAEYHQSTQGGGASREYLSE